MAHPDDRPDEDFAPLEPEERPSRERRRDRDDAHYDEPHRGVLILVLGIVGLVACPLVGVAAWIMGSGDMKKMDEGVMDPEGRSNTQVGKILGIVATIILALQVVLVFIYLVVFGVIMAGVAANAPKQQPPVITNQGFPKAAPAPKPDRPLD